MFAPAAEASQEEREEEREAQAVVAAQAEAARQLIAAAEQRLAAIREGIKSSTAEVSQEEFMPVVRRGSLGTLSLRRGLVTIIGC